MAVRNDCRHYLLRTTASGEALRRCRLSANQPDASGGGGAPGGEFACPDGCMFFEPRVSGAGWAQAPAQPMSNTAANLPDPPKRRNWGRGKRKR